jgi:GTPase Era involved in 16S rRNA processing
MQVKGIVVGAKGRSIGEIGVHARLELQEILAKRVHLIVNVKNSKKQADARPTPGMLDEWVSHELEFDGPEQLQ